MWATNDSAPNCRMLTWASAGKRMRGRHHEKQFIQIDDDGMQLRLLRIIREDAEFRVVAQHVSGNVAAQRALHRDADHGMQAAEFGQHRQQVESGEFVGRDAQFAAMQLAQFSERAGGIVAQVEQALGILLQDAPGIGQQAVARGAVEERLAHILFQLVNRLAHRRLGAMQFFRRPGKFPLPRHRQKHFQLSQSPYCLPLRKLQIALIYLIK